MWKSPPLTAGATESVARGGLKGELSSGGRAKLRAARRFVRYELPRVVRMWA